MWIFYLVEVLDSIKIVAGSIMVAIAIAVVVFLVNSDDFCYECEENHSQKTVMKFLWAFFLALTVTILCPSKRTSYTMLGVGTIVDYLKDNDTAKQLPDKAIIALDKWLDTYMENDK